MGGSYDKALAELGDRPLRDRSDPAAGDEARTGGGCDSRRAPVAVLEVRLHDHVHPSIDGRAHGEVGRLPIGGEGRRQLVATRREDDVITVEVRVKLSDTLHVHNSGAVNPNEAPGIELLLASEPPCQSTRKRPSLLCPQSL